jgi:large subunit ribosomal protein L6
MSRIGKKPITLPSGVTLDFDRANNLVTVSGPLGKLSQKIQPFIGIEIENGEVIVSVKEENTKYQRAIWGTTRAVVQNLVQGVSTGFTKEVELNGVGYKMELGNQLVLYIGFSHPVKIDIPTSIKLSLNKNLLSGQSIDKHLLGDFFMSLHNMKPCDVYKQKGFKFPGKVYRKKVGKKAK